MLAKNVNTHPRCCSCSHIDTRGPSNSGELILKCCSQEIITNILFFYTAINLFFIDMDLSNVPLQLIDPFNGEYTRKREQDEQDDIQRTGLRGTLVTN